jgi:hypothetical protein
MFKVILYLSLLLVFFQGRLTMNTFRKELINRSSVIAKAKINNRDTFS